MEKLRQKLDEFRMLFDRLSAREKVFILALTGSMFIFVVIILSFFINISLNGLEDRVETKRNNYSRILSLEARFNSAEKSVATIQKQIEKNKSLKITQIVGNLAEENGITVSQISQASGGVDKKSKTRELKYKIELRKVELAPLLKLLSGIEKANRLLFVRNLNMRRRYNNKSELDATFFVTTVVPLETEG